MAEGSQVNSLASIFVDVPSTPWIDTAPGNKTKIIYHDKQTGFLTVITKLEPGAGIPDHVHADMEQTLVLEGSFQDHEGTCTAGNFVIRPKGSRHAPIAPNGCTMVVFFVKGSPHLLKLLGVKA